MSMNIHIEAHRAVTVNKTGKQDTQTICWSCEQTPTAWTNAILNHTTLTPVEAYIFWVLKERSHDEQSLVYADDDLFCEREPIGFKTVNYGKEHVAELREWIKTAEEEGYEIEVFSM